MTDVIEAPAAAPAAPPASAPPATPPAAAPAAPAAASPAPAEPPPAAPASKWSDTWREDMAGTLPETATAEEKADHAKLLGRLKRFNTPADAAKAIREQDKLISSGTLKRPLPKDATEAQIAEWRKDNGIPAKPEDYDLGIPKDVELTEGDQQLLAKWAAKAHARNATPEAVQSGAAAFLEVRSEIAAQMEQANAEASRAAQTALRAEWGAEYDDNVDGVTSMLRHMGGEVAAAIANARTTDGVKLVNQPEVVRALASQARMLGFVGTTVAPAGGDLSGSIDDQIKAIQDSMFDEHGNRNKDYMRDTAKQEKLVKLLAAKERLSKA